MGIKKMATIDEETLQKVESNIKAMKVSTDAMFRRNLITPHAVDDLRSLTSRNLQLVGGDVCDLCGDPTKSTTVCWPCWHLETVPPGEEEIVE